MITFYFIGGFLLILLRTAAPASSSTRGICIRNIFTRIKIRYYTSCCNITCKVYCAETRCILHECIKIICTSRHICGAHDNAINCNICLPYC
nr:MAG TPA: hypothetical protein [Caudoviricetes sp.]